MISRTVYEMHIKYNNKETNTDEEFVKTLNKKISVGEAIGMMIGDDGNIYFENPVVTFEEAVYAMEDEDFLTMAKRINRKPVKKTKEDK